MKFRFLSFVAAVVSSAVLLILSFPPFSVWIAAYFFAVPLLVYLMRIYPSDNGRKSASIIRAAISCAALSGGWLGYGAILYWICPTVIEYTGSVFQGVLSLLLIAGYLSLYMAVFFVFFASALIILHDEGRKIYQSILLILIPPFFWVALEYVRSSVFTGFPWAVMGYSQWNFTPALWVARYGGVFAVSFMIILANMVFAWIFFLKKTEPIHRLFSGILIIWLGLGIFETVAGKKSESYTSRIPVSVIQPSIYQSEKWDPRYYDETKKIIRQLVTESSAKNKLSHAARKHILPDGSDAGDDVVVPSGIILWPETSLMDVIKDPNKEGNALPLWMKETVMASGCFNIVGALLEEDGKYYNTSLLVSPSDGKIVFVHKKTHLVPFGEFVPFRKFLEPYFGIFGYIGDLTKGNIYTVMDIGGGKKISPIICSENLSGDITRRFVRNGAGAVFVLTNDAWYGKTPAAFQHFTFNVLRAVENDRWVVQSANTGVSGVVSPEGKIIRKTPLFEALWFESEIPLKYDLTFYTKYGDLFAIISCGVSAVFIIFLLLRRLNIKWLSLFPF